MRADHQSGSAVGRARAIVALLVAAIAIVALGPRPVAGHESHGGTPSPVAAACSLASPQATDGTPAAAVSPGPQAPVNVDSGLPHVGTSVATTCLTVTLTVDKMAAGPRTLVVEVVDPSGAPVTDAEVMIHTRSLVMDHGISTNPAIPTEPGRYEVEHVSMGMAGAWQAEVVVTRPGSKPVTVAFVVDLEGPA